MESKFLLKFEKYLKFSVIGIGLAYCISYLIIAIIRMQYPYELEWMEGGMVEHIIRILAGKDIYVRPSLDFIPYIYTPLYFWIGALVSKIMGVGFVPLRLLSFASSLVSMLFIYMLVHKETGRKFPALVSMSLFPACFLIGGSWFDLARVDSLFLALLLASAYILRFKKTNTWYIIAGIIAFLSFFTKQSGLVVFCFIGLFLLFENWKRSLYFILTFAVLAVGSTLIYNHISNGWYYFWNFSLVADHRWNNQFFLLFWTQDLFKPLSIAMAFSLFLFVLKVHSGQVKDYLLYIGMVIGMIACAWISRLHYGGYDNVLIPAYIILIIFTGIGFYEAMKFVGKEADAKSILLRIFILIMLLAQFTTLYYNPRKLLPHPYDLEAGNLLISHISKVQGDVFVPTNSYISRFAGKKSFTHMMLVFDLMQSNSKYADTITKEFEQALAVGKFAEIYLNDWFLNKYQMPEKYYERKGRLFSHVSAFIPITGFLTRPDYIYVPRKKQ